MHLLKSAIIKYFLDNGLDTMTTISSSPANEEKKEEKKKTWIGLIDESVHTSDDVDIGDIDAVSRDLVVVKRGIVNIHYYYIPIADNDSFTVYQTCTSGYWNCYFHQNCTSF